MSLQIYNTQTRRKEEFIPLTPGEVRLYVCGVTVYDDPHIGHARCYLAFDAIVRHLRSKGWKVTYVRNFTDVDDKIIKRANETGVPWNELAQKYIDSFNEDMEALGLIKPDWEPRATEHITEMTEGIAKLLETGHAYKVDGGDVLFEVDSMPDYGKLSGRKLEDMQAGARISVDQRKKNPMDFVLWKAAKPGEPTWDSPFGEGRPGWHIECSVMSAKYLGETFDIHGGGEDLVFPHHENEMAQSEALTGKPFARYWLHNGFVRVNEEKMSKSLGNFFTIKDVLRHTDHEALRMFLLSTHYRSPLDFSDQAIAETAKGLRRLYQALLEAEEQVEKPPAEVLKWDEDRAVMAEIDAAAEQFDAAMDDDFNTPRALAELFNLARIINRLAANPVKPERDALIGLAAARLKNLGGRLGLLRRKPQEYFQAREAGEETGGVDPAEVDKLVAQRTEARKNKDFAQADAIRDQLTAMGVLLEDTPQGTRWRME
jgi:cysteinyl-tRNA synthetase